MVDQAENYLEDMGFRYIRARHRGKTVNIEVAPDQVPVLQEAGMNEKVTKFMLSIGYEKIRIDPEGYRRGKMNDEITGS